MNQEISHISEKFIVYLRDQLNDQTLAYTSPLTQLQGGFETQIYRFQLRGAGKELLSPLILRLYPEFYGTGNAVWESTVQNVLAAKGYPVAKVHCLCTDMSVLGGAFFVMDSLPGKPMVNEPFETIPGLLGKTHAALHSVDPKPLIMSLGEQGFSEDTCHLDSRYAGLETKAEKFPWLCAAVDWLLENRPPEPEQLAICHGDFHPLNILVHDGKVSGVLDWPGFLIADPILDIANTLVLTTIPFKHLAPSLGLDITTVDFELFTKSYLDAYQAEKTLDKTNLDFYRVRRCVNALIQGSEGQMVWQQPPIVKDLIQFIHSITGVEIANDRPD